MASITATIITAILLLPIFLLIGFFTKRREIERIRGDLKRRDCQLLDLQRHNSLFAEGHHYRVTYSTPDYEIYTVQCKTGFSKLFWSEPELLFKVSAHQFQRMLYQKRWAKDVKMAELKDMTDKEKLVDSLTSRFTQERLWSVRQIHEIGDVEDQVIPILEEMATTDPDIDVRDAVLEVLQKLHLSESSYK